MFVSGLLDVGDRRTTYLIFEIFFIKYREHSPWQPWVTAGLLRHAGDTHYPVSGLQGAPEERKHLKEQQRWD